MNEPIFCRGAVWFSKKKALDWRLGSRWFQVIHVFFSWYIHVSRRSITMSRAKREHLYLIYTFHILHYPYNYQHMNTTNFVWGGHGIKPGKKDANSNQETSPLLLPWSAKTWITAPYLRHSWQNQLEILIIPKASMGLVYLPIYINPIRIKSHGWYGIGSHEWTILLVQKSCASWGW